MRVLYHHRTLGDGAEGIHVAEIVEALRALGHDVRIVGQQPFVSLAGTGRIHRIRAALPEIFVQVASICYNAWDYLKVRRAVAEFEPDILYKRHARYDVAAITVARRYGIPVILEVNAVYSARPYRDFEPLLLQPLAEVLERKAFASASSVYAVSTPMARQVAALGRPDVLTLPNGTNPARFDPLRTVGAQIRQRFGLERSIVVGWTGILREWHGLDLLLASVAAIPGLQLLLVGDGPARAAVQRQAGELGISQRVHVTGRVPHAEMPDYIAAMDIAVVAADHTGVASPMKLLEYMSMSRAIVAPRRENIEDLIRDGHEGVLFVPGDMTDLSARLRQLAQDASLREALGAAARRRVEVERNWYNVAAAALATVCSH